MKTESVSLISERLKAADEETLPSLILSYENDERKAVRQAVLRAKKRLEKLKEEDERLTRMLEFERKYPGLVVCGLDEVGRGPLAGPVTVAAVILPEGLKIRYVNDSKKLSEIKREELSAEIKEKASAFRVCSLPPERIDDVNILNATKEAMVNAVNTISVKPDVLLIDALTLPVDIRQEAIIKGDARSLSIASASIIAKVERDACMKKMAELYPEYGFEQNKGYGTAEHIAALRKYGPCPIHRKSFIQNLL